MGHAKCHLFFAALATLACLLFQGCSNPPYRGNDLYGADEFVIDSYQIKQGKFSILAMEGKVSSPVSKELLIPKADVIESGDILNVALFHPTRKDICDAVSQIGNTVGFIVREGKVTLPDLDPVEVKGLSLEEARIRIQSAYLKEIQEIEVFLSYKDRLEKRVELAGLVEVPSIPIDW